MVADPEPGNGHGDWAADVQRMGQGIAAHRITSYNVCYTKLLRLPIVAEAVADYLRACPFPLPPDGPLFVGARGGPLGARRVQERMAELRVLLGLPDSTTPHALRR